MAIIKKRQLNEMKKEELINRLNELKLELAKEKSKIKIGGVPSNPGKLKEIRKTIARILTRVKKTE
ncbi:MAG: 50S ribosomal protein L29 [Candidatus Aenigmatarchaeota archaeon]|nr:50S ribosomal protein L29 [Candidatus Aenigmarchaeota archaeon]